MSRICCAAVVHGSEIGALDRTEPERPTNTVHDEAAVAAGQHPFEVRAIDLDAGKARPADDVLHVLRIVFDIGHGRDGAGVRYSAGPGDTYEVYRCCGMARLPARFA